MKEFTYRIEDPHGMHARPAGKLATYAKQFDADIRVQYANKEADGKRLLALMGLGATHGADLHFVISGADEARVCEALERFCRETWQRGV